MGKENLSVILKSLRKEKNLTQKQLAKETGLSLSSIISYENGLREPNSKAMVVLEKYFHVSGEFLRGEITKEEFSYKSDTISNNLTEFNVLMEKLKVALDYTSLENHKLTSEIAVVTLKNILSYIETDSSNIVDSQVLQDFYKVCSSLNIEGQKEIIKRGWELTYVEQYKFSDKKSEN